MNIYIHNYRFICCLDCSFYTVLFLTLTHFVLLLLLLLLLLFSSFLSFLWCKWSYCDARNIQTSVWQSVVIIIKTKTRLQTQTVDDWFSDLSLSLLSCVSRAMRFWTSYRRVFGAGWWKSWVQSFILWSRCHRAAETPMEADVLTTCPTPRWQTEKRSWRYRKWSAACPNWRRRGRGWGSFWWERPDPRGQSQTRWRTERQAPPSAVTTNNKCLCLWVTSPLRNSGNWSSNSVKA